MKRPTSLQPGDKVAIVSPASAIDPKLIEAASQGLTALGYRPVVMPHAAGRSGSYSASVDERLSDMKEAMLDREVRAILCSRGGYGAVHLLAELDMMPDEAFDKWLIGFSDISALHSLWARHGMISIHGSMARSFTAGIDSQQVKALNDLLTGGPMNLQWKSESASEPWETTGTLRGGNLAVLQALIATPWDNLTADDTILFIEDIAEPIYKVERIINQLRLSGRLERYNAVIVGQFTDYKPDANYTDMYPMLRDNLGGLPVVYNAPIGHVPDNQPILHGARVILSVDGADVKLFSSATC